MLAITSTACQTTTSGKFPVYAWVPVPKAALKAMLNVPSLPKSHKLAIINYVKQSQKGLLKRDCAASTWNHEDNPRCP